MRDISGYFGVFRGVSCELKVFLSVFELKNNFCSVLRAYQDLVKNVISTLKIEICRILKIVSEGYVRGISGYFGVFRGILGELKVFFSVFEPKKTVLQCFGGPRT